MAIVYNVPFDLEFTRYYPNISISKGYLYFENENEVWTVEETSFEIEENEDVSILFNSEDKEARLYLSALDILPSLDDEVFEDEEGYLYRKPSDKSFFLYKSDCGYDELRVDEMLITIICYGVKYYGKVRILPKPISLNEWHMMRDDLESEIRGLSQDLVRKNIGLGGNNKTVLPPKLVYDFLVIEKYSRKILPALIDISENPRFDIKTYYEKVAKKSGDEQMYDAQTIKRFIVKSGSEATVDIPVKCMEFDIQENRLLKLILNLYEKKLSQFISILEETETFSLSKSPWVSTQYKETWNINIGKFKENALKLKKITSIIRTKEWYSNVGEIKSPYIPHSFIMDTRYNVIYQMFQELKKENIKIKFDSKFSYTWKRSSLLYEMWCFFKLCRILLGEYDIISETWNMSLEGDFLFPFLDEGTKVEFINNYCMIELIYDKPLPTSNKKTSLNEPLYIAKRTGIPNHIRPDIVMNVYDVNKKDYYGTIIFECKYRKFKSFWNSGERSSRNQLESYFNNARSLYLFNGIGDEFNMRPVNLVVALTPDILGNGKKREDFNIVVKPFKPGDDKIIIPIKELINEEIRNMIKKADKLNSITLNKNN